MLGSNEQQGLLYSMQLLRRLPEEHSRMGIHKQTAKGDNNDAIQCQMIFVDLYVPRFIFRQPRTC